jgi:hypothetical protein
MKTGKPEYTADGPLTPLTESLINGVIASYWRSMQGIPTPDHYPLDDYTRSAPGAPVFRLAARAQFSPLDVNVAYLARSGWNQAVDRLRFQGEQQAHIAPDHPLAKAAGSFGPHLLVRRLEKEEDRFVSIHAFMKGDIIVLSNDAPFARSFLQDVFLECPPSFHTLDELDIAEEWRTDAETKAMFAGMLMGASGWDPSHNIPDNIQQSLDEAKRSLEIANYRASVAMSRRTLEAVLKFGYERLLKKKPVNAKGKGLMLNDLIQAFRGQEPALIPEHLLHLADSLRVIGNVPGAHASDIDNYHFSRSDADFAFYGAVHFLDQYFTKIDTEVTQYYAVSIDISPPE